jgi:hypothetical protein
LKLARLPVSLAATHRGFALYVVESHQLHSQIFTDPDLESGKEGTIKRQISDQKKEMKKGRGFREFVFS